MRTVQISGKRMLSIESTHRYLKRQLALPDYYGANLDALWDLLSTKSDPVEISLKHLAVLRHNLGDYGDKLIKVFEDAERTNPNLQFRVSD